MLQPLELQELESRVYMRDSQSPSSFEGHQQDHPTHEPAKLVNAIKSNAHVLFYSVQKKLAKYLNNLGKCGSLRRWNLRDILGLNGTKGRQRQCQCSSSEFGQHFHQCFRIILNGEVFENDCLGDGLTRGHLAGIYTHYHHSGDKWNVRILQALKS